MPMLTRKWRASSSCRRMSTSNGFRLMKLTGTPSSVISASERSKAELSFRHRARNDFGGVNAVAYDPGTGTYTGVGDPRRWGSAMGLKAVAPSE